jgi:hypothetical protein
VCLLYETDCFCLEKTVSTHNDFFAIYRYHIVDYYIDSENYVLKILMWFVIPCVVSRHKNVLCVDLEKEHFQMWQDLPYCKSYQDLNNWNFAVTFCGWTTEGASVPCDYNLSVTLQSFVIYNFGCHWILTVGFLLFSILNFDIFS